ncbi:MAG: cytochrome d ubiquinol oxidase subunit II [Ignavibacteria bacterium GWB2_35_12]|nr:MAG: cytochrome d ubiquinol oxidase subunit II [Ignavibacteria bacterium GWB2_35_12]OGU90991.1 MAG: cytochrome d ubiquinol oxidase subunit II [Ignavibacteria bacterium RIFOXYA2_FULL_35_10]OGV22723.1 MAG: cytochrome d ubiquinol oxidase subunit II [Ignavibacteria bacterium RIFOXYC2_FULL_35_21]
MELNIIWFVLLTVLFGGYVVLDGFDLGVGMIHLGLKSDLERRTSLNAIGPVWDANEVWLITAGGALFAAFPDVYATVFSGFYTAFMLFLLVIIGRAISIEFRGKVESDKWKKTWDFIFCLSSYLIVLLLGVSLGNIITGIPIYQDKEYAGTFFTLLNPYAVMTGITAVLLIRMHGKIFLAVKTEGEIQQRVAKGINSSLILFVIAYIFHGAWTIILYPGVIKNFVAFPVWFILPAFIILSIIVIPGFINSQLYFRAFVASCTIIAFCIAIAAIDIYPNLVISNPNPENSLTIFNASSSQKTLMTMLIIACIGLPLMFIYKIFVYRIFRGKVKLDNMSY